MPIVLTEARVDRGRSLPTGSEAAVMRNRMLRNMKVSRPPVAGGDGQALVVAVLAMFVVLLIGSYVIDVANWHAQGQKAQSAADAAALAGASCLGSSTCSYSTAATTAVQSNGGGVVSVSTNSAGTQVNVTVTKVVGSAFASLAGIHSDQISRSASAAQSINSTTTPATCAFSAGTPDCIAIFAGDTCSQSAPSGYPLSTPGVYLDLGYTTNIAGTILSNGGVNVNQQWNPWLNWGFESAGLYYGAAAAGCTTNNLTSNLGLSNYGYNSEYVAGNGKNGTTSGTQITPTQLSSQVPYPEYWGGWAGTTSSPAYNSSNVNETTPACTYTATTSGGSKTLYNNDNIWKLITNNATTDGHGNITINATNATIPSGVFCAPNGTITIAGSNSQGDITMIARSFGGLSVLNNIDLAPCGSTTYSTTDNSACSASNPLLMMQTGSGELLLIGVSSNLQGTIFAPTAFLYADSIGSSSGFLEAAAVEYCAASLGNSFTISGTGPSTATLLGGVSLVG